MQYAIKATLHFIEQHPAGKSESAIPPHIKTPSRRTQLSAKLTICITNKQIKEQKFHKNR